MLPIKFKLLKVCSVIEKDGCMSMIQPIELDPLGKLNVGFIIEAHTNNKVLECFIYEENIYPISALGKGDYVFDNRTKIYGEGVEKIVDLIEIATARWISYGDCLFTIVNFELINEWVK